MIHPLYLIYDYNENIGNTGIDDLSSVQKAYICLHFCLFFATMQYDDFFMTESSAVIAPNESCNTYKICYFCNDCHWFLIFLNFIVRMIHSLLSKRVRQSGWFLFFYVLIKTILMFKFFNFFLFYFKVKSFKRFMKIKMISNLNCIIFFFSTVTCPRCPGFP